MAKIYQQRLDLAVKKLQKTAIKKIGVSNVINKVYQNPMLMMKSIKHFYLHGLKSTVQQIKNKVYE